MATQRYRLLCTGMYETLNQLNPGFMSNIFKLSSSDKAARKQQVVNFQTKPDWFWWKTFESIESNNVEQPPTTCTSAYQGARNISFSENFAYVLNG